MVKHDTYLMDVLERIRSHIKDLDCGYDSTGICSEVLSLWQWGIDRIEDKDLQQAIGFYYAYVVPVEFFVSPSSITGKHPSWHNKPGGIVRHLTECCVKADRKIMEFGHVCVNEQGGEHVDPDFRDRVLAATVITDTFKNDLPWGKTSVRNHGEIAARYWQMTAHGRIDEATIKAIAEAVHWHYGRYTPVPKGTPRKELRDLPELVQMVHQLDMCSSDSNNEFIYRPVDRILSPEIARCVS